MTINPQAVSAFLKRPRANSDKAKRFTDAALDRMLARMDPVPEFVHTPWRHQKICFLLGAKYGSYLYLLDMGLGKTKVALDLFRWRTVAAYFETQNPDRRMLVLVPGSANIGGWLDEARTHAPNCRFLALDESLTTEQRRTALLGKQWDVACITYQGWAQMVCSKVTKRRRGKRAVTEWAIDKKKAKAVERLFDEVIFDESDTIQNPHGLYFRTARRLMKQVQYTACLTGTVFNRNPESMWAQFYVVDRGESLGEHLGLFRAAFFVATEDYWKGVEWKFDPRMEDDLYRVMRHRSVRFTEDECHDLPKKIGGFRNPMIRSVVMPPENWAHYEKLVAQLEEARGNYQLMENAYVRMRMLVAGYLPLRDDDGTRRNVVLPNNPKMDALMQLLREIPETEKVIVVCVYHATGDIISQRLTVAGIPHVRLYGKTKNKSNVVEQFKHARASKCRVMLASQSGAKGHNFQHACHYTVFYETPPDPSTRAQWEKRTHRAGQKHRPHYYELHVRASIDARILRSLQDGRDLFDALVDGTARPSDLLAGRRVAPATGATPPPWPSSSRVRPPSGPPAGRRSPRGA